MGARLDNKARPHACSREPSAEQTDIEVDAWITKHGRTLVQEEPSAEQTDIEVDAWITKHDRTPVQESPQRNRLT